MANVQIYSFACVTERWGFAWGRGRRAAALCPWHPSGTGRAGEQRTSGWCDVGSGALPAPRSAAPGTLYLGQTGHNRYLGCLL